jgi:GNAT superfamily N-acetyltransferase
MSWLVRAAAAADVDALVEGNLALAAESEGLALDAARVRAGVEAGLAGAAGAAYRVAVADGRVVGQLMRTVEWSDWRNQTVWWVQSVYVWPAWRGRGVYRALAAALEAEARAAGAAGLRLYVDTRNTGAAAVYERLGMDGGHYRVYERLWG